MSNKTILKVMVVLSLCLAGNAFAVTTIWTGGGATTDWRDVGNWDNGIPDTTIDAVIGGAASTVDLTGGFNVGDSALTNFDQARSVTMGGGTLNMDREGSIAQVAGTGVLTQTGGTINMPAARDWINMGAGGIYNMSGGTIQGHGWVILNNGAQMTISGTASYLTTDPSLNHGVPMAALGLGSFAGDGHLTISGSNAAMNVSPQSFVMQNLSSLTYEFDAGGIRAVTVTDNAALTGTLDLTGVTPSNGTYTLMTAGSITDNGFALAAGLDGWSMDIGADTLTVTLIPEPATITLLALSGFAIIRRKRR